MKIVSDTAIAVHGVLSPHANGFGWDLVSTYRPVAKLSELGNGSQCRVSVVPRRGTMERLTRGSRVRESFVDVGIQAKIRLIDPRDGGDERADLDGVLEALDNVADLMFDDANATLMPGGSNASQLESAEVTLMEIREVQEGRVATAVLTLKYISMKVDNP